MIRGVVWGSGLEILPCGLLRHSGLLVQCDGSIKGFQALGCRVS